MVDIPGEGGVFENPDRTPRFVGEVQMDGERAGAIAERERDVGWYTQHIGAVAKPVGHERDAVEVGYRPKVLCVGKIGVRHDGLGVAARSRMGDTLGHRTVQTGVGASEGNGAALNRPRRNILVIVHNEHRQLMGGANDRVRHIGDQSGTSGFVQTRLQSELAGSQ